MNADRQRRTVYYRGQVQGVGFRYTARRLAGRRPVAGYVRNLANGQVEIVVEGNSETLDAYLGDVAQRMGDCIADYDVEVGEATGEFDAFDIRF
jgi:acylphosphatase